MQCLHITYGTSFLYFKSSLDYLQYNVNVMQVLCIVYCLGNDDKKKVCMCSVQMQWFLFIFNLQLVEPEDAEPRHVEG
jgi:hypothetical protein